MQVTTSVASVAAGERRTCAVKTNGTLWCWGDNMYGQLGTGTGTYTARLAPFQVTSLGTSVSAVVAGQNHSCALKTDGTVWCWGNNPNGQLGTGDYSTRTSPVQVSGLTSIAQLAAGEETTCARKTDGTLYCWGENYYRAVGNGLRSDALSPVQVAKLGNSVSEVKIGMRFACARKTDGTLWCWGDNEYGMLGADSTAKEGLPVRVMRCGDGVCSFSRRVCARLTVDREVTHRILQQCESYFLAT